MSEPRDNGLRLTVQQAIANKASDAVPLFDELPELATLRGRATPIESTENCKTFEIVWGQYVAYLVTEEMAGSYGNVGDEAFTGKLFRLYSKSHFLEYLSHETGGHTEPLFHYKVVCLNHLIDVVAYRAPEIRIIGSSLQITNRIQ